MRETTGCVTNGCKSGRRQCPTPQACHQPIYDDEPKIDFSFIAWTGVLVIALIGALVYVLMEAKWT